MDLVIVGVALFIGLRFVLFGWFIFLSFFVMLWVEKDREGGRRRMLFRNFSKILLDEKNTFDRAHSRFFFGCSSLQNQNQKP